MDKNINDIFEKIPQDKSIAFVSGNFNIVHPGHLRLLRFAAECADFLVVGVVGDGFSRGIFLDEQSRLEGIKAISIVSHSFILQEEPHIFIKKLKPRVVVKGREFETVFNIEQQVVEEYGGSLLFGSGEFFLSSGELVSKEISSINHRLIEDSAVYMERHRISPQSMKSIIGKFKNLKITVIGDLIIDEYIACDPLGMSQEDPTIVVTPTKRSLFLGGAGIVAAHAKSLGAGEVSLVSLIGSDAAAEYAKNQLFLHNVTPYLQLDSGRPTTLKQRFRVGNKTLLRVSNLRQHKIDKKLQDLVFIKIQKSLVGSDLLIFSDFNYGCLPQELVIRIIRECRLNKVLIAADSQSSSQIGDISRYAGADLITPTEREARLALGNYDDGLVVLANKLRLKTGVENIVITLGAEGLLVNKAHTPKESIYVASEETDRIPALNLAPIDPAGAGDCFLVTAAMALAVGATIWESAYIGSLSAACQVARVGNVPLLLAELLMEVENNNL